MVEIEKTHRIKSYKQLKVWQKTYYLCRSIYKKTGTFPKSEQFGLTSQIKRSALSAPSNIAEGHSRGSTRDYIRFLYIAFSSLSELETQLLLAKDLGYLQENYFYQLNDNLTESQKMIYGLIKTLNRSVC